MIIAPRRLPHFLSRVGADRTARRSVLLSILLPVVLSLAGLLPPATAGAQVPGDNVFSGFQPSGDFLVEVDGKEWPKAEVYQLERPRAYLVMVGALPAPVLLELATRQVSALDLMKVAKQADGSVNLLSDAQLAPQGLFELSSDGQGVTFKAEGRSVRLKSRPWLLGPHTAQELLDSNPEYGRRAAAWVPDADTVKKLKALPTEATVRVFFGSWCPHCKQHVPFLLRLAQELQGSKIRFDYYGLPSPFRDEPEAAKWGVTGVPTAIVLVGGKELGRVPATGWSRPDWAILDLLTTNPAAAGSSK